MTPLTKKLHRLLRLHLLIRRRATGTATCLADRLGVSRSTIFNYLDDLEALGAEIEFCPHRCSYVYQNNFCFWFGVRSSEIDRGGDDDEPIFFKKSRTQSKNPGRLVGRFILSADRGMPKTRKIE